MARVRRRFLVFAVILTFAGLVSVTTAGSAGAAPASFDLSPASGVPGSSTTASDSGGHCAGGDTVSLSIASPSGDALVDPVLTTADGSGSWAAPLTIPLAARTFAFVAVKATCLGNADGYSDHTFGITAAVTPSSGPPTTTFHVQWYCVGLATVAVTTVSANPVLVSKSAFTANGDVDVAVFVSPSQSPGQLRVVAACAATYGGYGGGGGYSGYGVGAVIFAPAFFTVTPYPSSIAGTVTGTGGVPLVGYGVQSCSNSFGACQLRLTDASGHYTLGAFPGTYTVRVLPPFGSPYAGTTDSSVVVGANETVTRDFSLILLGAIDGTITLPFPGPVFGGSVTACPVGGGTCLGAGADFDGHYHIAGVLPGDYLIAATAGSAGFAYSVAGPVTVSSGATTTVNLSVVFGTRIEGAVTGTGGAALTGTSWVAVCPSPFHPNPIGIFAGCPGVIQYTVQAFGDAGLYQLPALGVGTWHVRAGNSSGGVDTLSPEYTITISGSGSISGVDFTIGDAANVAPEVEDAAPPPAGCPECVAGDGNGDGIPDSSQLNVASLPSAGQGQPYVTIAGPADSVVADVSAMDPSALPPLPGNASLPLGALGFEIRNVNLGEEVDVSIYFPAGIAADQYWKFTAGEWTDFTANTAFFSDHVVLHLVDGGAGDADGQANGVIVDPSGLVNPPPVALSDRYTTVKKAAISVGAPGVLGNDERVAGGAAVLDTGPAHGVLTLNVDGSFTYSPEGTFVGTDVFTYHVERTDGAFSEPGTVTLSVLSPGAQCDLSKYPSKKGVRNLKNANLAGCYLVGVDLSGADLGGAILTGANLQAANLAGANLAGANLTRAILVAANLTGAKLTRANLTDVVYGSTTCPDGSLSDNNGGTCAVI